MNWIPEHWSHGQYYPPREVTMNEWKTLEKRVLDWAEDRRIIPNSDPLTQAIKTTEEVAELLNALSKCSIDEARDAYGDILVTMIIGAKLQGVDLLECLADAYEVIKDRKGHLRDDGIFVKEE